MGAPDTLGKLCTSTDQMEVDDFIKCVYVADASNVAGEFYHLGENNPKYIKLTTKTTTNADTNESTTTVENEGIVDFPELPTSPSYTACGYFYFIKAEKGMLIADRAIQYGISWEALNKKDYIYGGVSDGLLHSDEDTGYLVIKDGKVLADDDPEAVSARAAVSN